MLLVARRRTLNEGRVDGDALCRRAAGEQPELAHGIGIRRHQLLDPGQYDVHRRDGRRQPTVALVGAHHHRAGLGNERVRARDAHAGPEEDVPDGVTRGPHLLGDVLAGDLATQMLGDDVANLLARQVDRRHHHMARPLVPQLDDPLAEIGFDNLHAEVAEVVVELDLLADHRLRLGDDLDLMIRRDLRDDPIRLVGVLGEVDDRAGRLCRLDELAEVVVDVVDRLSLGALHRVPHALELDVGHHVGAVTPPRLLEVGEAHRESLVGHRGVESPLERGVLLRGGRRGRASRGGGGHAGSRYQAGASMTMTCRRAGPCTPTVSCRSMSAVRLGPVTRVA